jgi:hypothetical protein
VLVQGGYGPRRLRGRTGRLVCRLFSRSLTYDITVTKGSVNMFTSTICSKAHRGAAPPRWWGRSNLWGCGRGKGAGNLLSDHRVQLR